MFSWLLDLSGDKAEERLGCEGTKQRERLSSAPVKTNQKKSLKKTKNGPPTELWILLTSCAQSLAILPPLMFHFNSQSPSGKTWFLFSDAN